MEAAENRRALALNIVLTALAAFIPFWFYNHGVKYPMLLKVSNMFRGLAWDPIGLNLLLAIPFVVLADRTLRRAGSLRKSVRLLIIVLGIVCFIYVLQIIFMLAVWSINGFAP
jgi:hypothetical protein